MATGGTIPTSKTQSVTFFNTTGVIEKDKNIYLAPRFKKIVSSLGKEVRVAFLDKLMADCPPSSAYTDIAISGWSPQDRTLVVKGNIDDFRLVTEEGACLNYFVVTRSVTKNSTTRTYYYGFFITGVEQLGGASVKLTIVPDDFSNVFYLHNSHVLTSADLANEYEPFNERMKNCYVQRQHYNRVYVSDEYWVLTIRLAVYGMSEQTIQVGEEITIECEDADHTTVTGEVLYVDDRNIESQSHELNLKIKTDDEYEIGTELNFSNLVYNNINYTCSYNLNNVEWDFITVVNPVNQEIFLNQEESFKYKYQYRDKKIPFALSSLFTESELASIDSASSFSSLTATLRKKILKSCVQYMIFEMKSQEMIALINASVDSSESASWEKHIDFMNNIEGFYRYGPTLFVPFMNVPDLFKKFENDINLFNDVIFKVNNLLSNSIDSRGKTSASLVYSLFNQNSLADFIYSSYVVDDVCLIDSMIDFDLTNHYLVLNCDNGIENKSKMLCAVPIYKDPSANNNSFGIQYVYHDTTDLGNESPYKMYFLNSATFAFMITGYNNREIEITNNEAIPNLKNNFFDPVLEAEPYSFYSLSYLSYEMPFNKNRYYQSGKIKVVYYISVNGAIKISYIPSYTIEGKEFKYYNEGLVFTIPANMPLLSDSYASYYYQNQAQMKNQFAVNDYNRGVDLAQHFFISGPNAVGMSASKRGGWGALAETGNQFMEMADEAIDWAQSNKVIEMNQKAKLADVGAKPDVVKQTGSDVFSDLMTRENRPFLNHYVIDSASYNSIAKYLERFGYQVSRYITLNVMNRVGWNFVKLVSFDLNPAYDMMTEQEDSIKKIFNQGVTLLHDKSYLTSGHNYETILDE